MVRKRKINKDLLASECETSTSLCGVLAGLTFTASTFIFSFRTSFPHGEIFLTLTLVSTVCFVYATVLSSNASGRLTAGDMEGAVRNIDQADNLGVIGFFLLLAEISFIAFSTEWQYGVVVSIVVILGFLYSLKY